jgi:hypothetical protein
VEKTRDDAEMFQEWRRDIRFNVAIIHGEMNQGRTPREIECAAVHIHHREFQSREVGGYEWDIGKP